MYFSRHNADVGLWLPMHICDFFVQSHTHFAIVFTRVAFMLIFILFPQNFHIQLTLFHYFLLHLHTHNSRDVRPRDMVSVSRPKFEISCLGLGLVLIVSVSSLMVSCLEAFRDLPSVCDHLKWLFLTLDHSKCFPVCLYHNHSTETTLLSVHDHIINKSLVSLFLTYLLLSTL